MLCSAMLLCFMLQKWLQNEVQYGSKMVPKWLQNGAWEPPDGVQNLILAPLASWRALGTLLEASRAQKNSLGRALVGQKKSFKTGFSPKKIVKSGPRASKSDLETGFKPKTLIFTVFFGHRHFCIRTASGAQKTRLGGPWSAQKKLLRQVLTKKWSRAAQERPRRILRLVSANKWC